jgi:hypothetical protein
MAVLQSVKRRGKNQQVGGARVLSGGTVFETRLLDLSNFFVYVESLLVCSTGKLQGIELSLWTLTGLPHAPSM